ncbi:hypothetical protein [Ekhidna sp. To15]|uniref:hypothetical protein n=1 Tax=Ekhidna sp. To15 TaxID=3395267 RepID=UPI003F524BE5
MAEYQTFEPGVEAGGNELPIVALGALSKQRKNEIIEKYGLNTQEGAWNDLQSLLNAMKEIADSIGEMNLFMIGKEVMEGAAFPPMDGLESALRSIDVAYHMNHRKSGKPMFDPATGKMTEGIGHYELVRFDEANKEALLVCHTPYPSKFEEGLIVQIARTFKPEGSFLKVQLDETKETRRNGGERCTFKITW